MSGFPISVIYCSWSPYKKEEWSCIKDVFQLDEKPGYRLGQLFNLEFRKVPTTEPKAWYASRWSPRIGRSAFLAS